MHMKYNNRDYPHPVLGIGEDIHGTFSGHLTVKSTVEKTILNPIMKLKNTTLETLLESGKASMVMHVYCRGTMFRDSFKIRDPLSDSFEIPTNYLSGETEVDYIICANEDFDDYNNSDANKLFENTKFSIQKGYILAYGGKGKFYANKSPEKLKAVSSFMRIKRGNSESGPFLLDYSDNKFITIELSSIDYDKYHLLKSSSENWSILHASIVFPALIEVASLIRDEESGIADMSEAYWFINLSNLLAEARGNSIIEKVQYLLDLPLNRALEDLDQEE